MMQDPRVVGKKFESFRSNFFTQPFQYVQIVNLVDYLSSWYKFIMNEVHSGEFANFIIRPRNQTDWYASSLLCHFISLYMYLNAMTSVNVEILNKLHSNMKNTVFCNMMVYSLVGI